MIMNMDLGSLRIGQPTAKGGFFNYGLKWLAEKAKISFSRAKRVISNLKDAMIISSYQYRELIDKEKKLYIAHNAARVFDMDFFTMLQINAQKFGKARKLAHQKQKDKEIEYQTSESKKEEAVASLNMKRVMAKLGDERGKLKSVNLPENEEKKKKDQRLQKKRMTVMLELQDEPYYAENPVAFEEALRERLVDLNLLFDHEKAT
jgi:hypothetical protein